MWDGSIGRNGRRGKIRKATQQNWLDSKTWIQLNSNPHWYKYIDVLSYWYNNTVKNLDRGFLHLGKPSLGEKIFFSWKISIKRWPPQPPLGFYESLFFYWFLYKTLWNLFIKNIFVRFNSSHTCRFSFVWQSYDLQSFVKHHPFCCLFVGVWFWGQTSWNLVMPRFNPAPYWNSPGHPM